MLGGWYELERADSDEDQRDVMGNSAPGRDKVSDSDDQLRKESCI